MILIRGSCPFFFGEGKMVSHFIRLFMQFLCMLVGQQYGGCGWIFIRN